VENDMGAAKALDAPQPQVSSSPQQTVALRAPQGFSTQEAQQLQRELSATIDEAERWLRAKAGDAVNGSRALSDLQSLRVRAQATTTPEGRAIILKEIASWKGQRMGQGLIAGEGLSSTVNKAQPRDLVAEIDEAEQWLRKMAGKAVHGSKALEDLQQMRQRALAATTQEERAVIRSELASWRRKRSGQAASAEP
jgi:hypothetical protein